MREQALFDAAVVLAKDELRQLEEAAEGEDRDIILFQRVMLDDPALNREVQEYIAAGAGSAAAMERAAAICARRIESVDDEYIRQRSADVLDACRRVVNILDGRPRTPVQLEMPSILAGGAHLPKRHRVGGAGHDPGNRGRRRAACRATPPSLPGPWASPRWPSWARPF